MEQWVAPPPEPELPAPGMLDKSRPYGESVNETRGRHYLQDDKWYHYETLEEIPPPI
jgi:hypothetical protein